MEPNKSTNPLTPLLKVSTEGHFAPVVLALDAEDRKLLAEATAAINRLAAAMESRKSPVDPDRL
jgi:hypothetical protein